MKSRIETLADYKQAEFPREIDVRCPEEYLQKKLRVFAKSGKRPEAVSILEKGDTAVLTLVSELSRFNRPMVTVAVGSGLYDKGLEERLVGHAVGESFMAEAQGKPVSVTIRQATRMVFPELTDELVTEYAASQGGMEDVKTVADFHRWAEKQYREEQRQEAVIAGTRACFDYVLTGSKVEFDEAEISEIAERMLNDAKESMKARGQDFDSMSDEKREQVRQKYRRLAEKQVAISLWVAALHGVDPAQTTLDEINKLDRDFLADYVSNQLNFIN